MKDPALSGKAGMMTSRSGDAVRCNDEQRLASS